MEKQKSLSFLLSFDVEFLPDKVMLGYINYPVRDFVPNTLRCYRCQAYGHVAVVCRREVPRCEKCAEGYETKECVAFLRGVVCVVDLYQYREIGQQVIYVSVRLDF